MQRIYSLLNFDILPLWRFFVKIALVVFLPFSCASAKSIGYQVDIEWSEVEDALGYDLELTPINRDERAPKTYRTEKTKWTGEVFPGKYQMRIRALDARKVPGRWSESQEISVLAKAPGLVSPKNQQIFNSSNDDYESVTFRWDPLPGIEKYKIKIQVEGEEKTISEKVSGHSWSTSLPVGKQFDWQVISLMDDDAEGAPPESKFVFSLVGKTLDAPKIKDPENEYAQSIEWSKVDRADSYDYSILQYTNGKKWTRVAKGTTRENSLPLAPELKGGKFLARVRARGKLQQDSKWSRQKFDLASGERTPAAFQQAQLREIFKRPSNWYALGSYFITAINYSGDNAEIAANTDFSTIGGTARVGVGYLSDKSRIGGFGFADISGFNIKGQNFTYRSIELHATYERNFFVKHLWRVSTGLFYKELPETVGSTFSSNFNLQKISYVGPHLGGTYALPLNSKFGLQFNGRFYLGAVPIDTPNGKELNPQLSFELGSLVSYRVRKNLVGYLGYAYRSEKGSYNAVPGNPADPDSTSAAAEGAVNQVQITGHYMNMLVEWSF